MLHDDDGIADIAQGLQGMDEALIVALVKTDAGLVEDIEHVDELGANLRGQTDTLALATRERSRLTV